MAEVTVLNELFNVSFPFIRSKIAEFTSDFRPGFVMPTFDTTRFDFTKNITFNLEVKRVNNNNQNNGNDTNLVN